MTKEKSPIDICNPGSGASCALCCGSHNYHAGRDEIGALFNRRHEVMREYNESYLIGTMTASRSNMTGSYYYNHEHCFTLTLPALFADCPQCPFVGLSDAGKTAGCLLLRKDSPPGLRRECFLSYRGKVFSCRAREILRDDEILYAAKLMRDWYYYSILIHSPDLLRALILDHPDPGTVPDERRRQAYREMEERIMARRELHAVHGYFD